MLPPTLMPPAADALDSTTHIIQVALTPVFLLSGIGTLLNVFNTRLARVADHSEHAADLLEADPDRPEAPRLHRQLRRLRHRTVALDLSIALSALGGATICSAVFALFIGAVHSTTTSNVLLSLFGLALVFTIGALAAFVADTLLAWHGLRSDGPLPHVRRQP